MWRTTFHDDYDRLVFLVGPVVARRYMIATAIAALGTVALLTFIAGWIVLVIG